MGTVGKICSVVIGAFMIIMGICSIIFPGTTFVTLSWLWAVMLIVGGIFSIIAFFVIPQGTPGRGLTLFSGIVQLLLGIMLVSNGAIFTAVVSVMMLQIWIIFSGIESIVGSFEEKKFGVKHWWIALVFGILCLIVGMSTFSSALFGTTMVAAIVGVGLILSGVSFISRVFTRG